MFCNFSVCCCLHKEGFCISTMYVCFEYHTILCMCVCMSLMCVCNINISTQTPLLLDVTPSHFFVSILNFFFFFFAKNWGCGHKNCAVIIRGGDCACHVFFLSTRTEKSWLSLLLVFQTCRDEGILVEESAPESSVAFRNNICPV